MRTTKSVDSQGQVGVTLMSISLPSNVEFVNNVRNAGTGARGFLPIEI